MIRVTADTNIYVSALQFAGSPLVFLNRAIDGAFQLAITDALMEELREVLQRKFRWPEEFLDEEAARLARLTVRVTPTQTLNVIPEDPDDNRVVECAVAAGAQFIVTGDRHLLRLGEYEGIRIVKVTDFLNLLPPR